MNINTASYYKLQERMQRAATRHAAQAQSLHNRVNASIEAATGYFAEAGNDGVRDLIRSMSNLVSASENTLIANLTSEQAVRVWKAINNGINGNALDHENPGLTDFESKLANLQLAGLALYATAEVQALGMPLTSHFDLQGQPDGSVTVREYPPALENENEE